MTGVEQASWDWDAARMICLREARRLLRDRHEAEDAAQEAVVRAWRARDRCRSDTAATQWLRTIAANEAHRICRRSGRFALEDAAEPEALAESRSPVDERLGAIACDQMLAPLGPKDRQLMRLRYVAGLTQAEIAKSLRMPEGTVKVRLHRSRHYLRRLLSNETLG